MAILKEFNCRAHGNFEAYSPVCPYGCSERFVDRVILTAPAYHTGRTARTDRNLRGLAEQAGLTDMKNDPKSGESVMSSIKRGAHNVQWAGVPEGQVSAANYGVQPDAALKPGQFKQPVARIRTDPRGMSDLT